LGCPESITQVYGARSYTYDSPLANWQHMVRSEGLRKVRGWQKATQPPTHRTTQGHNHFVYASRNILQSLFRLSASSTAIGIIIIIISPHNSRVTSGWWILQDAPGCPGVA